MPPGRPIAIPSRSLPETIAELEGALGRQPADVPVWLGRVALDWLKRLQEREDELFRLRDLAARHEELSEIWTQLRAVAEARGIEIYQPLLAPDWRWRRGAQQGSTESAGAALVAALLD